MGLLRHANVLDEPGLTYTDLDLKVPLYGYYGDTENLIACPPYQEYERPVGFHEETCDKQAHEIADRWKDDTESTFRKGKARRERSKVST